ncbi:MAG TPA: DUF4136 domain-containing protein [Aquabacterium sp.]|uniref:DUF4136 domain-containing protein n=1 Tax=Aquabacterium sp. TaxID=1872578 RepID=UPI002E374736|nr:DUF4136 domain-containing protein [Aquabacterium sp.]HEX5355078.1 DUF4136 domain-containing protein [Aquabacterium sp.]
MSGLTTHIWKPLLCAAVVLLTACAGPRVITSQVSSSGTWPEGRKPGGHYVFERLPSQQTKAEVQDKLEAAAQPALAAAGFEPVADPEKADVSVQVGVRVQIDQQRAYYRDPFWGPGPWRPGLGGWWGGGRGGLSMSLTMEPPWVVMTVDLLISDRRSKQTLYETHARYDRQGVADDRLYPWLFEAALKDFPHQAVSPRAVTVTIPDDNH